MHRKLVGSAGLLLALIAVFGLAACGDDDDSGDGSGSTEAKTIYLNQYTREIPYFQEIAKGMDEAAEPLGWTVDKTYGNADPAQQVDQIQNAIVTQPDAMVVIPIDEEAISPAMREATSAGIPVAAMGDDIADETARDFFLGVDYEAMGTQKAEWLVEELGGQGKIGFIHGIRGLNFTEQQNTGARAVFDQESGIEVVDGPYTGGFSSDLGLKATENLLAREPDLDALYFDNDDLALGGIQAVSEAGINPDEIVVIGTDGGPAALDAVKAGDIDYTISLCGFAQGKQVIDVLDDLLNNDVQPESDIITETLEFTPDTYEEQIPKVKSGEC